MQLNHTLKQIFFQSDSATMELWLIQNKSPCIIVANTLREINSKKAIIYLADYSSKRFNNTIFTGTTCMNYNPKYIFIFDTVKLPFFAIHNIPITLQRKERCIISDYIDDNIINDVLERIDNE